MRMWQLAWANLKRERLSSALSLMLLALGVAMVSFIVMISDQLNDRFDRDIRGIDMVVGAKGSPLQLILSAVYQIDNPTGNIPVSEARKVMKHPLVKYTIPLSYGDSYKGFRIVGTDTLYLNHFGAKVSNGTIWNGSMEVVLGSEAAASLGLGVGAHFHGTHGFEEEGTEHAEMHYDVVGVLDPTGSVADRLILTSTESVWDIHHGEEENKAGHEHHDHEAEHGDHDHDEGSDRQITALLVKFRSPMGMMQLPRFINEKTAMQAALPAIEINRLYEMMGVGFTTLRALGVVMMIIAAISVFISLLNSLKDRKQELALMRSLGASPKKLFALILQESLILCSIGYMIGVILARFAMMIFSSMSESQFRFGLMTEGVHLVEVWLLPISLLVGLLAAFIPALRAYRTDISSVLRND